MRRFAVFSVFMSVLFFIVVSLIAQDVIEVTVHGISDGVRHSKQRDRDEAIIDAKLKAVEKTGVSIKSVTEVENFQLKRDWIESQAEAYIMPGFIIIEIGYGEDGIYHVVLSGKLSTTQLNPANETEYDGDKMYRYGKSIMDKNPQRGTAIMLEVVDKYPECESADDALWMILQRAFLTYGEIREVQNIYTRLKEFYPASRHIASFQMLKKRSAVQPVQGASKSRSSDEYTRRKLLEEQHRQATKSGTKVELGKKK